MFPMSAPVLRCPLHLDPKVTDMIRNSVSGGWRVGGRAVGVEGLRTFEEPNARKTRN